jgi:hypothetical protein
MHQRRPGGVLVDSGTFFERVAMRVKLVWILTMLKALKMNITELIKKLETLRNEHGDIEVVTDDYCGGDYEMNEPLCGVRTENDIGFTPVVILNSAS